MTRLMPMLLLMAALAGGPAAAQGESPDVAALRTLIQQTADAINAHNPDGVMAHYSKEVLVSYPGVPDTTYEVFSRNYRQMMNPSIITRTVPAIEEILVSGDLASIRMTWSTSITDKATGQVTSRRARDLQIWRRENGAWKFFRGMWYHVK